jgi:integrase
MSKKKLSPATIRLTIAGVKTYVDWCRDHDEMGMVELKAPKMPKLEIKTPLFLTNEQLVSYFKTVAEILEPSRTALLLLPYCGMRVTEICTVELKNITTETDKAGKRWTIILIRGKGNKFRSAPLLPQGTKILASYLQNWRSKQRKSKWLFPGKSESGVQKPLSAKTIQAHMRNIRKKIGLPEALTPHILRKTCFTHLYRRGVSLDTIARIAGHTNTEVTLKYYIAPTQKELLDELGRMV